MGPQGWTWITEVVLALAVIDLAHGFMWTGLDPGSGGADKSLVTTGVYLETSFMEASLVSGSPGALVCRSWPGTWRLEPTWRLVLQRLGAFLFHSSPQRIRKCLPTFGESDLLHLLIQNFSFLATAP